MELNQALKQATDTSKTLTLIGNPRKLFSELDILKARHGDKLIRELIDWNEQRQVVDCSGCVYAGAYDRQTGFYDECKADRDPDNCDQYCTLEDFEYDRHVIGLDHC